VVYQAILLTMTGATTVLIGIEPIFGMPAVWKTLALLSSAIATLTASLLRAFKYEENWTNYRQTAEALKKEKYQFETGLDAYYAVNDPRMLFVARVKSLISRESDRWVQVTSWVEGRAPSANSAIVVPPGPAEIKQSNDPPAESCPPHHP
jgi:hypothetical protein